MNAIIEKVYAVILGCGDSDIAFQKCIRSRVKDVVADGMALVVSKKFSKKKVKEMIEEMVRQSLLECGESIGEIRYKNPISKKQIELAKECIYHHSSKLISIAVDIMTFLL